MSLQKSQTEWCSIVNDTQRKLLPLTTDNVLKHQDSSLKCLKIDPSSLAAMIDHTLLRLDASQGQIEELCEEAKRFGFKAVCVRLPWVQQVAQSLRGSAVLVACVVGFREGTYSILEKQEEAKVAVHSGARELDMVINHNLLRERCYQKVYEDIAAVRTAAPARIILKVILETSVLSAKDIIAGCQLAEYAGADFVKTSSGFNGGGATIANVTLMKQVTGNRMKVKASGGIRTLEDAKEMIAAGADRLGVSNGVFIMGELMAASNDREMKPQHDYGQIMSSYGIY